MLPLISPGNRRLAALVALLYVFFSTFGALNHSHVLCGVVSDSGASHSSRQTSLSADVNGSAPAPCPVCDWQSLQVVAPPTPSVVTPPTLLRIEQTVSSYRLPVLPVFRSSSRGPPLA